jgi:hypothetical protein
MKRTVCGFVLATVVLIAGSTAFAGIGKVSLRDQRATGVVVTPDRLRGTVPIRSVGAAPTLWDRFLVWFHSI